MARRRTNLTAIPRRKNQAELIKRDVSETKKKLAFHNIRGKITQQKIRIFPNAMIKTRIKKA